MSGKLSEGRLEREVSFLFFFLVFTFLGSPPRAGGEGAFITHTSSYTGGFSLPGSTAKAF